MLDRVRHFLQTGAVLPETLFPAAAVCFDALPKNLTKGSALEILCRILEDRSGPCGSGEV
jgi:hypothetical protein